MREFIHALLESSLQFLAVHDQGTAHRLFFQKAGEKYPDVIADKVVMSFACGRSVPDSLVDDKYRNPHGQLTATALNFTITSPPR